MRLVQPCLSIGFLSLLLGGCAAEPAVKSPSAALDLGPAPDVSRSGSDASPGRDAPGNGDRSMDGPSADASPIDALPPPSGTLVLHDHERITSRGGDPNFQNLRSTFDFGPGPFEHVSILIDLDTTCFPFEGWADDPPPEGQRWPPSCDAFDRNFELVLDDPLAEGDPPGFEVMRAITPFGGPSHHEIDVTDLLNAHPGSHRLRTHITTWSDGAGQVSGTDGGWFVTLKAVVTPGTPPRRVLAAVPLIDAYIAADFEVPDLWFDVPGGTVSTRIEYRVTGHGGAQDPSRDCIGAAEEFCRRVHRTFVDNRPLMELLPWRDDCADFCTLADLPNGQGQYCKQNPTGSIRSVRAARANWCPGALTEPFVLVSDALLVEGRHRFAFEIPGLFPGGGWRTSATFYAYGD